MSTNPFKAFIPYIVDLDARGRSEALESAIDHHESVDPHGAQWRTLGLVPPYKGEKSFAIDIDGVGTLMCVQFNERILPGKVRDELLRTKVEKLEKATGRKVGKKEYAQLREEAETDLLPKAFIRRTQVPVIFTQEYMLICTSSQKRADDAVSLLMGVFGVKLAPWKVECKAIDRALDDLAHNVTPDMGDAFLVSDSAVLKGADKKRISIKDKWIGDHDVQKLIEQHDYDAVELGIKYVEFEDDEDSPTLAFVVSDQMIFKRVEMPNVKPPKKGEEQHGYTVIVIKTYRTMLNEWVKFCGGLVARVKAEPATPATTDEDDL